MTTALRRPVGPPRAERWPAVAAVGAGTFTLVTSELLPVGLLTHIADDLGVSVGATGTPKATVRSVSARRAAQWSAMSAPTR